MNAGRVAGVRRRDVLLSGVGALAAATFWSVASAAEEWDLIVVGAGTAGLPAAIAAANRKLRVLVVEKAPQLGGTLWVSGGEMSAAGTQVQLALGIHDRPEYHLRDIQRISGGTADSGLAGLAVRHAAATVDWLMQNGLKLAAGGPTYGAGHEPYGERRIHAPEGNGLATLSILRKLVASTAPTILYDTSVEELIQSAGVVRGVVARTADGQRRDIRARNVLIASGGHNGNPQMFRRLTGLPLYRRAVVPNGGIGIDLGLQAGGYVRGGENFLCDFGGIPVDFNWPSAVLGYSEHHPDRRPPWEIYVNICGERFIREDEPSVHRRETALLRQPEQRYWVVFDESVLRDAPPLMRAGRRSMLQSSDLAGMFDLYPTFRRAPSLERLSALTGLPEKALSATVRRYNAAQESGRDWLGREHMPAKFTEPPYYAICHQGSSLVSFAGIAVNEQLQVVQKSGAAIRNLFAAGEVLGFGNVSGRGYCGGMSVTPALTFGRLIGEHLISA